MTHKETIKRWLKLGGVGVEIGAFERPVPLIKPFYVDRFSEYAGKKCLADYWGDACHIPFKSNSLDYVVTSHVLEHVANPVAAMLEWHRVLKHRGFIYMVVPDHRYTFDHKRNLTTVEHMWKDYSEGVNQRDSTHVMDYLDNVDWHKFHFDLPEEEMEAERKTMRDQYLFDVEAKKEFNLHFHVFQESNLTALIESIAEKKQLSWQIKEIQSRFPEHCPNGTLFVIQVRKKFSEGLASVFNSFKNRLNRHNVLSPDAQPLSEMDEMLKIHP